MALVMVTKDFAVDPNEVVSLEKFEKWDSDPSPSGRSWLDHTGTIVIQRNGRKTYVRDLTPAECHDLIFGKIVSPIKKMQSLLPEQAGVFKYD